MVLLLTLYNNVESTTQGGSVLRKNWLLILAMVILATLCIVGCGDDDDGVVTPTVTAPATFTNGEIYTYDGNGLYFYIYTFTHGGNFPEIDSIIVDTMPAIVNSSYYWNYADPYWYSEYYEGEDPSDYESGDNVTISMYGVGRSSSCNISILDYNDDAANIISPEYGSNVDPDATVEIVWNQVENAEYYAIYTERRYDSSGTMTSEYVFTYTLDTTYTMPERFTETTVDYFYCYVLPTCGPDPSTNSGNWTGSFTTGVLYSYGNYDYAYIYVSSSSKANSTSKENGVAPDITPREIIQGLFE